MSGGAFVLWRCRKCRRRFETRQGGAQLCKHCGAPIPPRVVAAMTRLSKELLERFERDEDAAWRSRTPDQVEAYELGRENFWALLRAADLRPAAFRFGPTYEAARSSPFWRRGRKVPTGPEGQDLHAWYMRGVYSAWGERRGRIQGEIGPSA